MRRVAVFAVAFIVAATTTIAVPGKASAAGPPTWFYNEQTKHSYALVDGVTWADAEAYGVKYGGHLATIDDPAEQDWLTATFPGEWHWIGLNDRAQEGKWVWSSGKRVTYTDWQPGQPDAWKGWDPLGEDAAVLNGPTPGWVDISERWLLAGIIEVPGKPRDLSRNVLVTGTHDGSVVDVAAGDLCYANGWAWAADSPKKDVTVRILAARTDITIVPKEVWRGRADQFRPDLAEAGIGDGTAAFWVDLRGLIEWYLPYVVTVQGQDVQTGEWATLDGSPRYITCTP